MICFDIIYVFIYCLNIDLTDFSSYDRVVNEVGAKVGNEGLNVLFNNAGIATKFTRLGMVKMEQLTETYLVNTVVPIMFTKVIYTISNN